MPVIAVEKASVVDATSRSRSSIHGRCALATGPRNARVTCRLSTGTHLASG